MSEKKTKSIKIEQNNAPLIFCEKLIQLQYNNDVVKMAFITEDKNETFVRTANIVMSFGDFIDYVETINKLINDDEFIGNLIEKNEERKKELIELKNKTKK